MSPDVKTRDQSAQAQAVAVGAAVAESTVDAAYGATREILTRICELWLDKAHAREPAAEVSTQNGPVRQIDAAAVRVTRLHAADFAVVTTFEVATAESRETRDLLPGKLAGLNEVMDAMMAVALGATRL